jgi:hypothetical protein
VNEADPCLAWECLVKNPDYERSYSTSQKEPVDIAIFTEVSKDSARPNQPPYDRGIKEHTVLWTSPWAVVCSAKIGNSIHHPPGSS